MKLHAYRKIHRNDVRRIKIRLTRENFGYEINKLGLSFDFRYEEFISE